MSVPHGPLRRLTAQASVLRAPNAGPMTLEGTNSYRLTRPGSAGAIIVDPGPGDPAHLTALADTGSVALILITHRHHDHTDGAAELARLTGAPVRAFDPDHSIGAAPLHDGEVIEAGGVVVSVVATPGHTTDSVCFLLAGDGPTGSVLTGDTVLGRGTTVIAHPDGRLGPYLDSLRRLVGLGPATVLPGHGPMLLDLAAVGVQYLEHREQRLSAIRAALAVIGSEASVEAITDAVYLDIDPAVRGAAERSVATQLDYLRAERARGPWPP